jgi:hypothetical protein
MLLASLLRFWARRRRERRPAPPRRPTGLALPRLETLEERTPPNSFLGDWLAVLAGTSLGLGLTDPAATPTATPVAPAPPPPAAAPALTLGAPVDAAPQTPPATPAAAPSLAYAAPSAGPFDPLVLTDNLFGASPAPTPQAPPTTPPAPGGGSGPAAAPAPQGNAATAPVAPVAPATPAAPVAGADPGLGLGGPATPATPGTPGGSNSGGGTSGGGTSAPLTVVLAAPRYSTSATPAVTVRAFGGTFGAQAAVSIDVDLNHDGQFSASETKLASGTVWVGNGPPAVFALPTLAPGSYHVRAEVSDPSGDAGSGDATVVVGAAGGGQPVYFEANQGQAPAGVDFVAHAQDYTAALSAQGAVFTMSPQWPVAPAAPAGPAGPELPTAALPETLAMRLAGADPNAQAVGLDKQKGVSNYFLGNDPSQWVTKVANYAGVQYANVYQGIDLTYGGDHGNVEYAFTVHAGADLSQVRLDFGQWGSWGNAQVLADGELLLTDPMTGDSMLLSAPAMYQNGPNGVQAVKGGFVLNDDNSYGFQVTGPYDPTRDLVIDPVYNWATYVGGSADDHGLGIAVDADGNSFVVGWTTGFSPATFPPVFDAPGFHTHGGDAENAVVTEFDTDGHLIYSTFYSGKDPTANTRGLAIAVDHNDNVFFGGSSNSTTLPTPNGFNTTINSGGATPYGFVAALDSTGSSLLYGTYYGGVAKSTTSVNGVAVDGNDDGLVWVTGNTDATGLQTTAGVFEQSPPQKPNNGTAFVASFDTNASGNSSLLFGTYVGGTNGFTTGRAIAVDTGENAVITGEDNSDLGQMFAPQKQSPKGGFDAYVLKLNADGEQIWGTYIGGSGDEQGWAITLSQTDEVYVGGDTNSTDFPVSIGAFQTGYPGGGQPVGFVTKLSSNGQTRFYSTYLGGDGANTDVNGNSFDRVRGIAVDNAGDAVVAGTTTSSNFPVLHEVQDITAPTPYGFVTELNQTATKLLFSTVLGAKFDDVSPNDTDLNGVGLDAAGNIYAAGDTFADTFITAGPLTATPPNSVYWPVYGGVDPVTGARNRDIVVVKLGPPPPPPPTGSSGTNTTVIISSITPTSSNSGGAPTNPPDYDWFKWTGAVGGNGGSFSGNTFTGDVFGDNSVEDQAFDAGPIVAGTFTAKMRVTSGGTLELHLFTTDANNTLIPLGQSQVAAGGDTSVSATLAVGEPIYVEVKGLNSSFGFMDGGSYTLVVTTG